MRLLRSAPSTMILKALASLAGSKLARSRVGRANSMYLSVLSYAALMLERPSSLVVPTATL